MRPDALASLVEELEGTTSFEQAHARMHAHVARLGMSHFNYLCVPGPTRRPIVLSSYSQAWYDRYVEQDYLAVDPVVVWEPHKVSPSDWSELRRNAPRARRMFEEAREFGVGRSGATLNLRGREGGVCAISISCDLEGREWEAARDALSRELFTIGLALHDHVTDRLPAEPVDRLALSPFERECLLRLASGRTIAETADILSVKERSLRFRLERLRAKLGADNVTHAVARALSLKLIAV